MRWKTHKKRKQYKDLWHTWFAWYPVVTKTDEAGKPLEHVWLETVWRKGTYCYSWWDYEYRVFGRKE
jgi:hypothetical protein